MHLDRIIHSLKNLQRLHIAWRGQSRLTCIELKPSMICTTFLAACSSTNSILQTFYIPARGGTEMAVFFFFFYTVAFVHEDTSACQASHQISAYWNSVHTLHLSQMPLLQWRHSQRHLLELILPPVCPHHITLPVIHFILPCVTLSR